jgi:hypothetical protein
MVLHNREPAKIRRSSDSVHECAIFQRHLDNPITDLVRVLYPSGAHVLTNCGNGLQFRWCAKGAGRNQPGGILTRGNGEHRDGSRLAVVAVALLAEFKSDCGKRARP